ncbi:MAG TPA: peptide-methionine (R)-S-oxide reductase MsrB [Candidatus Acidoferrales bacterium]|nr:peptide-methionine (R)-S-oxide reductase MsrB [Candidatus Acidoferrales bacterium]HVC38788.1 peptide-methionine (R)-S-oxide reductase MsrB [Candidatus Dormibacteraeota bacterium]
MSEPSEAKQPVSDSEWRARLTPGEYHVLREKGTDPPFQGEYTHPGRQGLFRCAACGAELFLSETQFDSGSGWPSFTAPVDPDQVETEMDRTLGQVRTEVMCSRCGGHLGHVFDDGPGPTGQRWCINSTSLKLDPEKPV